MNDHLNENNLPEGGLSPDELAILKEALDTAWPPPPTSVRDGVMAQIRRERTAEKRRKLLGRAVKYGSLAACVVLIAALGFRALPSFGKSSDMAAEAYIAADIRETITDSGSGDYAEDAEAGSSFKTSLFSAQAPAEAVTEDAAEAEEEAVLEEPEAPAETVPETMPETAPANSVFLFTAAETECEIECEIEYETECEIEYGAEYETECETEAAAENLCAEAAEVYSDAADAAACPHSAVFADSYHTIPEVVIACTGEDVYLAWLDGTEGCDRNIAEYMEYMEENTMVLLSDIEMIYDATDLWYRFDWNFDLFDAGNTADIEAYYRNGGSFADMVKRESEYRFKLALLDETGAEKSVDVCAWSIADLVEEEGMTLSTLTAVYESSADEVEQAYPGYAVQEYDLAALHEYAYSAENDAPVPPDTIAAGRHEDEMFRTETVK